MPAMHVQVTSNDQVIKVIEAKKTISWHFYVTRILPVGLFMAMTLAFGNLVYLYLGVAFIQMLKVCCQQHGSACTAFNSI